MLDLRSADQTHVRRLRVGASRSDPLAATLRARGAFAGLDLSPAWLAPSAILCIRSVRVKRSARRLAADDAGAASPLPRESQDALRAEIERLARAAARPARGSVAASSESVIFTDRAELLACLASDWCARVDAGRWWWRSLFGQTPDRRAVVNALAASPAHLPGALALLARRGDSVKFAAALGDAEARALLRAVTRRFALGGLESALARAFGEDGGETRPATAETVATRIDFGRRQWHESPRAPWAELAPEAEDRDLGFAARCLLGVSLAAARAPSVVRRAEFAGRARAWACAGFGFGEADARTSTRAATEPLGDARSPAPQAGGASSARARRDAGESAARGTSPLRGSGRDVNSRRARAASSGASRADDPFRIDRGDGAIFESRAEVNDDDSHARLFARDGAREDQGAADDLDGGAGGGTGDTRRAVSSSASEFVGRESWQTLDEARIETRFGGLFFLVNLALYLELYGDFSAPAAECLPLDLWDFVALLGRRLAGRRVESDAVWSLLARLAERDEGSEPGADFEPADGWRAPAVWLKPFGVGGAWAWSASRGRLRVRHPAGFIVIDAPLSTGEARHQLARETEPYREAFAAVRLRASSRRLRVRGANARERWIEIVNGYASARLRRALGLDVGGGRLARAVIERRARVFVTASHVDVSMSLAELPVEIRFAGLDRDPGFIPAAGRSVAFHFE